MHLQNIPDYFTKLHFRIFLRFANAPGCFLSPPRSQAGDRALSKKVSLINFHLTKKYHPTCFDSHLSWFKEKRSFHYRRNQPGPVISILKFINEGMKKKWYVWRGQFLVITVASLQYPFAAFIQERKTWAEEAAM